MGCLRLLLAICVVISHNQPMFGMYMLNGDYAVEIFFMVSGFYMALILNEKYIGKGSYKSFITNRFLKIFPTYYACVFATIMISLAFYLSFNNALKLDPFIHYFNRINSSAQGFMLAVNAIIFGQDVVMFTGVNMKDGAFFVTSNFRESDPPLYNFLLLPQAWSISVELMFYLIAPFIARKNIFFIFPFIAASFGLKYYTTHVIGLNFDPWTYRFFPSEVGYFLLGVSAYKLLPYARRVNSIKAIPVLVTISTAYIVIFYHEIDYQYKYIALCGIFLIAIPIAFDFFKRSKVDRYIGELSYPVYLIHYIIGMAIGCFSSNSILLSYKTEIVLLLSIITSVAMMKFIINPIDVIRQKMVLMPQVNN
ncbi:TPA: acyltransferase family protein [Escherichia coli]